MTWPRYRPGGSPGGMKNENTRTRVVPHPAATAATRRIRSSSGADGAAMSIYPMGEPMAETAAPAPGRASSASRVGSAAQPRAAANACAAPAAAPVFTGPSTAGRPGAGTARQGTAGRGRVAA